MERQCILVVLAAVCLQSPVKAAETILSAVLTPDDKLLSRQSRSYYDPRYGVGRPYDLGRLYDPRLYDRYYEYGRLEYDRPRCGRCDERYDDRDDDNDKRRDRYDDDRRVNHRPTYGNRYDRNKNDNDDDRRYNTDRNNGNKNGTDDDDNDTDKKRPYDDKDGRPSGNKRGDRDRDRNKHDDRDRYRPDYYDRFLRDPSRDRNERPYYDDPYRERRPIYERDYDGYPNRYDGYASRYDGVAYPSYRRPVYEGYDRGYDDGYGGYGPSAGRGPHDSFRPWDETYRGQAGWDAGGRGYYFASGRPDSAPAPAWERPGYTRPQESGWQNVGSYGGYRDPLEYRGSFGYGQDGGYRQDVSTGYGQASGWQSVGERRPYRDQSGVAHLDDRNTYNQPSRDTQSTGYGQSNNRQPTNYGQQNTYQSSKIGTGYGQSSSTTPNTSYLFQREDERVTTKSSDETTKAPAPS